MKEIAEQELKILEAQHPTRFQHLKLELKAFIHLFDEQEEQSFKQKQQPESFHLSILTQESSSKEREKMKVEREEGKPKRGRRRRRRSKRRAEEGISGAIQKAEACLRKIKSFKSLFGSSN